MCVRTVRGEQGRQRERREEGADQGERERKSERETGEREGEKQREEKERRGEEKNSAPTSSCVDQVNTYFISVILLSVN